MITVTSTTGYRKESMQCKRDVTEKNTREELGLSVPVSARFLTITVMVELFWPVLEKNRVYIEPVSDLTLFSFP